MKPTFKQLVDTGAIKPDTRLTARPPHQNGPQVTVTPEGTIQLDGKVYETPSAATTAYLDIVDPKGTINHKVSGWTFFRHDGKPLSEIRDTPTPVPQPKTEEHNIYWGVQAVMNLGAYIETMEGRIRQMEKLVVELYNQAKEQEWITESDWMAVYYKSILESFMNSPAAYTAAREHHIETRKNRQ